MLRRGLHEEEVGPELRVPHQLVQERCKLVRQQLRVVMERKVDDCDVVGADDCLHEAELRLHLLRSVEPDVADAGAVLHVDAAGGEGELSVVRVVSARHPCDLEQPVLRPGEQRHPNCEDQEDHSCRGRLVSRVEPMMSWR